MFKYNFLVFGKRDEICASLGYLILYARGSYL